VILLTQQLQNKIIKTFLYNEIFFSALCRIARDQALQATFSANSKQNSKIFYGVNMGPRANRLTKKRVENFVTLIIGLFFSPNVVIFGIKRFVLP
jgi:hypothetical protein